MKVVTASDMRAIEQRAADRGLQVSSLMQLAGDAVAKAALNTDKTGPIMVLVGPGNNGGDGLVAAQRLAEHGRRVLVYVFARKEIVGGSFPIQRAEEDDGGETLGEWLAQSSIIVDALLGIGQSRAPQGALDTIVRRTNEERRADSEMIAVDVPTGVEADSGRVFGDALRADQTVCMGFAKPGVLVYPGAAYAGRVHVQELGIPRVLAETSLFSAPGDAEIVRELPRRGADSNKGTFGRVLVIGGSAEFMGAPALVSLAAYRAGAGLLEVLVPTVVQASVAAHVLECVFAPGNRPGPQLGAPALSDVLAAIRRAKAVVFGPGMGLSDDTKQVTQGVLDLVSQNELNGVVVDADGLNALAGIDHWWDRARNLVLTPHPGEMARLTHLSVADVQGDRLAVAQRFAARWRQVVVLKGAATIVAAPDGRVSINRPGGPNLATAGVGDVLSGIIGGLLAQGCSPWDAAVIGVYLHGRAGDIVRDRLGDAGTLAGDLTGAIPLARSAIIRAGGE